jgi:predicted GNAT family acetyltransferase
LWIYRRQPGCAVVFIWCKLTLLNSIKYSPGIFKTQFMARIEFTLNEHHNGAFHLFEGEEQAGEMVVGIANGLLTVYHTEVPDAYAGKGYAKQLLEAMVDYAREHQLKVLPLCAYVHAQFKRHPELYEAIWQH